ncbi:DUF983 domain-containing protein [Sphingomonas sp. ASV193]|uniref:DUF983 domain-containing protein n=1 Tax=Sphingomonas sp. ASV193 TaxID=3144405 RepID=UPI0032E85281
MTGAEPPTLAAAALRGLCPQCGSRTLFAGWVKLAGRCRACGLDISVFNVGDGPAAFLILIVGAIVTVGALWLDAAAAPPWWVHLLWIPVGIGLTLAGLRIGKAALVFQEFRYRAGEGRLRK